ncbi:class I SAM-dependent methyltransferase [Wielerella bovis]|uniref:class I SAM-dependent methyltransferase n=1 Tax=Wielerella bovis TaxID=2917790 RepID=UPI002019CBBC|nr:class I SAM-dependent methyltransferase [Wielerella bovis]ULJ65301.1 class I SAM-dependent methyltransferase [Wielerella bovis]ULJ67648.1 class I SAM-dependent methyltransferase [Wielerella bovis]
MDVSYLQNWFKNDVLGRYLLEQEEHFFQAALSQCQPYRTLLLGHLSGCLNGNYARTWQVKQAHFLPADILADATHLPWREGSFDAVIAAHLPDTETEILRILMELYQVLDEQGCVLLTGFNPHSIWRIHLSHDLPNVGEGVALSVVRKWAESLGWYIEQVHFIHHLPPIRQPENWQLVEFAGRYLWTQGAAVYALVLCKQVARINALKETERTLDFDNMAAVGLARVKE